MQSTEVPPARGDDCFSTHTHTLTLSSHTLTHTQAHSHTIPAVRSFPQYRDRAAHGGPKLTHLHYRHPSSGQRIKAKATLSVALRPPVRRCRGSGPSLSQTTGAVAPHTRLARRCPCGRGGSHGKLVTGAAGVAPPAPVRSTSSSRPSQRPCRLQSRQQREPDTCPGVSGCYSSRCSLISVANRSYF